MAFKFHIVDSKQIITKVTTEPLPEPLHASAVLKNFILSCTATNPDQRPTSEVLLSVHSNLPQLSTLQHALFQEDTTLAAKPSPFSGAQMLQIVELAKQWKREHEEVKEVLTLGPGVSPGVSPMVEKKAKSAKSSV